MQIQCFSDAVEGGNGDIVAATLQPSNLALGHARLFGQLNLGNFSFPPRFGDLDSNINQIAGFFVVALLFFIVFELVEKVIFTHKYIVYILF